MSNQLSERLQVIANWVIADLPKNGVVIDIGTDDGALSVYLARANSDCQVFATDIIKNIIIQLKKKTADVGNIKVVHSFGLQLFQDVEIDYCVIAGMGVETMLKILKLDNWRIKNYIFQGIENMEKIRKWAADNKHLVANETIFENKNYYYHNLHVSKKNGVKIKDENDVFFGPKLRVERSKNFIDFWGEKLKLKTEIAKKIKNSDRKEMVKKEIKTIAKELNQDNDSTSRIN